MFWSNWFKKATVTPTPQLNYCDLDGTQLQEKDEILKYNISTGDPSSIKITKFCPTCNSVKEVKVV